MINDISKYLGNIDAMIGESKDESGKAYIHPALKNLGSVTLVILRETVAPTVFRNLEQEITDIMVSEIRDEVRNDVRRVRAVPNKFKHKDRQNGLRILRHYGVGGRFPQNKTAGGAKATGGEIFDLNSFVFGESAMKDGSVLPVKAAALYSDAVSIRPYEECVDKTFHNRASEDGSLWDAAKGTNSNNLFERHFIKPGTFLVQAISTHGKLLPPEGLDHLLLSLGYAGAYGGQTSVTGVNVKTSIIGVYGSKIERAETSPYRLAEIAGTGTSAEEIAEAIHGKLSSLHEVSIPMAEAESYRDGLMNALVNDEQELRSRYEAAAAKVGGLFDAWFDGGKK